MVFVDPMAKVEDITVGMQQVEICTSIIQRCRDSNTSQPTAVLTPQAIRELINIIET